MAISQRRHVASIYEFSPESRSYHARVKRAGGSVSLRSLKALDSFFYQGHPNGAGGRGRLIDFVRRIDQSLWLPLSDYAGIQVPLIGSNLVPENFQEADWNRNTGWLKGNAINKRLAMPFTGAALRFDNQECSFYLDLTTDTAGTVRGIFGVADANPPCLFLNTTANSIIGRINSATAGGFNGVTNSATTLGVRFLTLAAYSAADLRLLSNNIVLGTQTGPRSATTSPDLVRVLARGTVNHSNAAIAAICFGQALATEQREILMNAIGAIMAARSQ